jgi:hypothetical protein
MEIRSRVASRKEYLRIAMSIPPQKKPWIEPASLGGYMLQAERIRARCGEGVKGPFAEAVERPGRNHLDYETYLRSRHHPG